jgi:hypothetical protein
MRSPCTHRRLRPGSSGLSWARSRHRPAWPRECFFSFFFFFFFFGSVSQVKSLKLSASARFGLSEREEALSRYLYSNVEIKDRWYHLRKYARCFVAREAVDLLCGDGAICADRGEAVRLVQGLVDLQVLHHVVDEGKPFADEELFFRFQRDAVGPLNRARLHPGPARPPAAIAAELRVRITRLYGQFLSEDGSRVDYLGMKGSEAFEDYLAASSELQLLDWGQLSDPLEKMAFLVNVYNSLVIHGRAVMADPGAASSALSRSRFFSGTSYDIGGHVLSLDDIENGLLRANKAGPAALFSKRHFSPSDPRSALSLAEVDPRIHFVLNCGAASCPAVRVYTPEKLDAQLQAAASAFLDQDVVVDHAARTVTVSMIFKWFAPDFGSVGDWLVANMNRASTTRSLLDNLIQSGNVKIVHRPYNWAVNDKS